MARCGKMRGKKGDHSLSIERHWRKEGSFRASSDRERNLLSSSLQRRNSASARPDVAREGGKKKLLGGLVQYLCCEGTKREPIVPLSRFITKEKGNTRHSHRSTTIFFHSGERKKKKKREAFPSLFGGNNWSRQHKRRGS